MYLKFPAYSAFGKNVIELGMWTLKLQFGIFFGQNRSIIKGDMYIFVFFKLNFTAVFKLQYSFF